MGRELRFKMSACSWSNSFENMVDELSSTLN